MAALVAPLLMGAILYTFTRQLLSILFVALSPIFLLGNYIEGRRALRQGRRQAAEAYGVQLRDLVAGLDRRLVDEGEARRREHPSTAEVVAAAQHRDPLLWARRPDRHGFLELRLGVATQTSRTEVTVPPLVDVVPELAEELRSALASRAAVADVPVVAALRDCGVVGVSGSLDDALGGARALVAQVACLHSPAEVVIAATVPSASAVHWDWLKWLPHTTSDHSPLDGPLLSVGGPAGRDLVSALRELVEDRGEGEGDAPPGPAVVLLVEDATPVERSLLVDLAERGPKAGVHLIWVARDRTRLPAACTVFLDHDPVTHAATVGYVDGGRTVTPVAAEPLDAVTALDLARRLAPVVDAGARRDASADLPSRVALLDHLGVDVGEVPDAVLERWRLSDSLPGTGRKRRRTPTLHAVVGSAVSEALQLDLRSHGPHALVGGTTGAGKSEFLQTWVMALAATHSPARLTFLFVDYKGGSAFGDCINLPHSVGIVTDLTPHLVTRALTSLRAELRSREVLLNDKGVKDVLELEKAGDPDAPPSLVIIVDEFAALVSEVPEFVDGVVDVAQRGRSLGLHLVLATQRPTGVIKGSLRANTNLRVALRMSDEADSSDVVGDEVAARFDLGTPGRAAAKLGPGRLAVFQAAYANGHTTGEPPPPNIDVAEHHISGAVAWLPPEAEEDEGAGPGGKGPTDLDRMVQVIAAAHEQAGLPVPDRPWQPELEPIYDLARTPSPEDDVPALHSGTDVELIFGVLDDPKNQDQRSVAFRPDKGHMAVIGTGGAGKSLTLRTLAVAAGLSTRGGPCHVYALDFGARGLHMIEQLPHVGAVIDGDDDERVTRLLRTLQAEIDDRAMRYSAAGAGTLTAYRQLAGQPDEPRLLLLVDGYPAFRQEYEVTARMATYELFQSIVTEGRTVGVHVVVTADRLGAIPPALASVITNRLVLRLASEQEYAMAGVPMAAFTDAAPAGRGFIDGHEVQVAVLGGTSNTADQAAALQGLAAQMRATLDRPDAPPVRRLPSSIPLGDLPVEVDGRPAVGIAESTLSPFGVPVDGPLLVVGPTRSGKSTTLATLAFAARRRQPDLRLVYVGEGHSPLATAVPWDETVHIDDDEADVALKALTAATGKAPRGGCILVLDDVVRLAASPHHDAVVALVDTALKAGHAVLGDGDSSSMNVGFGLQKVMKVQRHGFALVPDQGDGDNVFRTPFPRISRSSFPPGRALYVRDGHIEQVQLALPEDTG